MPTEFYFETIISWVNFDRYFWSNSINCYLKRHTPHGVFASKVDKLNENWTFDLIQNQMNYSRIFEYYNNIPRFCVIRSFLCWKMWKILKTKKIDKKMIRCKFFLYQLTTPSSLFVQYASTVLKSCDLTIFESSEIDSEASNQSNFSYWWEC